MSRILTPQSHQPPEATLSDIANIMADMMVVLLDLAKMNHRMLVLMEGEQERPEIVPLSGPDSTGDEGC